MRINAFFGSKTVIFDQIVDSGVLYLASARDELSTSSPAGVKMLNIIENPFSEPIFYLLTGASQEGIKNL